ncbi:MAG: AtpZ/AtpI family protein [Lachnospiraceae bacterium]
MKYKREVFRGLALITQLGINVMVPIFLCLFAGYIIDKKFGTSTILIFLILGILAGGRNAYMLAKGVIEENERDKR